MLNFANNATDLKIDEGQKLQQIQTTMKMREEKQASVNVTETDNSLNKIERERQMTTIIQTVFQVILCSF